MIDLDFSKLTLLYSKDFCYFDKHPQRMIGIYGIRNKLNGKWYCGRAVNMKRRLDRHIKELECKTHCNDNLTRSWHKHGGFEAFEFYLVKELWETNDIKSWEQYYLDECQPFGPRGYNLSNRADGGATGPRGPQTLAQKEARTISRRGHDEKFKLKSPDGNIFEFLLPSEFCKENSLSLSGIYQVLLGKWIHHKRWTLPETTLDPEKQFTLISKDGEMRIFSSCSQFAKEIGVSTESVRGVVNGKELTVKGWKLPETSLEEKSWDLIDPFGRPVTIYNKQEFCDENNFNYGAFTSFIRSEKFGRQFQGWQKAEFFNEESYELIFWDGSQEETVSNLYDFESKYNIRSGDISRLINGTFQEVEGWCLKGKEPYELVDINGTHVKFYAVKSFCDKYNLSTLGVREVLAKEKGNCNGWQLPTSSEIARDWISPDSKIVHVTNHTAFSLENNLYLGCIWRVISGNIPQLNGWQLFENYKEAEPTIWIGPDGQEEIVTNPIGFAWKCGARPDVVQSIINGVGLSVNNWTLKKDKVFHTVLDPQGKEHKFESVSEFIKIHNLERSGLNRVLRGDRKQIKGWRLP